MLVVGAERYFLVGVLLLISTALGSQKKDARNVVLCFDDKCESRGKVASYLKEKGTLSEVEMAAVEAYSPTKVPDGATIQSAVSQREETLRAIAALLDTKRSPGSHLRRAKEIHGGGWQALTKMRFAALDIDIIGDPNHQIDSDSLSEIAKKMPCLCGEPIPDTIYDADDIFGLNNDDTTVAVTSGMALAASDFTASSSLPNDPKMDQMWQLTKTHAPEAWTTFTGATKGFPVAVIDTGCSFHPDIAQNLWLDPDNAKCRGADYSHPTMEPGCYGWDFSLVPNEPGHGNPLDEISYHGTSVAGMISMTANNGRDASGICWGCKIICLKVSDKDKLLKASYILAAYNFLLERKIKISNNSYRGFGYLDIMSRVLDRLHTIGHLFVVAAGNDGCNMDTFNPPCKDTDGNSQNFIWPAKFKQPNLLVVGSVGAFSGGVGNWYLAGSSNVGATSVDVFAPGDEVMTIVNTRRYNSTVPQLRKLSGTSFASPFVAGLAAMVWGRNPTFTHEQVKQRIMDTVDKYPALALASVSQGIVNVASALRDGAVADRAENAPVLPTPKKDLTGFFYRATTTTTTAATSSAAFGQHTGAPSICYFVSFWVVLHLLLS